MDKVTLFGRCLERTPKDAGSGRHKSSLSYTHLVLHKILKLSV